MNLEVYLVSNYSGQLITPGVPLPVTNVEVTLDAVAGEDKIDVDVNLGELSALDAGQWRTVTFERKKRGVIVVNPLLTWDNSAKIVTYGVINTVDSEITSGDRVRGSARIIASGMTDYLKDRLLIPSTPDGTQAQAITLTGASTKDLQSAVIGVAFDSTAAGTSGWTPPTWVTAPTSTTGGLEYTAEILDYRYAFEAIEDLRKSSDGFEYRFTAAFTDSNMMALSGAWTLGNASSQYIGNGTVTLAIEDATSRFRLSAQDRPYFSRLILATDMDADDESAGITNAIVSSPSSTGISEPLLSDGGEYFPGTVLTPAELSTQMAARLANIGDKVTATVEWHDTVPENIQAILGKTITFTTALAAASDFTVSNRLLGVTFRAGEAIIELELSELRVTYPRVPARSPLGATPPSYDFGSFKPSVPSAPIADVYTPPTWEDAPLLPNIPIDENMTSSSPVYALNLESPKLYANPFGTNVPQVVPDNNGVMHVHGQRINYVPDFQTRIERVWTEFDHSVDPTLLKCNSYERFYATTFDYTYAYGDYYHDIPNGQEITLHVAGSKIRYGKIVDDIYRGYITLRDEDFSEIYSRFNTQAVTQKSGKIARKVEFTVDSVYVSNDVLTIFMKAEAQYPSNASLNFMIIAPIHFDETIVDAEHEIHAKGIAYWAVDLGYSRTDVSTRVSDMKLLGKRAIPTTSHLGDIFPSEYAEFMTCGTFELNETGLFQKNLPLGVGTPIYETSADSYNTVFQYPNAGKLSSFGYSSDAYEPINIKKFCLYSAAGGLKIHLNDTATGFRHPPEPVEYNVFNTPFPIGVTPYKVSSFYKSVKPILSTANLGSAISPWGCPVEVKVMRSASGQIIPIVTYSKRLFIGRSSNFSESTWLTLFPEGSAIRSGSRDNCIIPGLSMQGEPVEIDAILEPKFITADEEEYGFISNGNGERGYQYLFESVISNNAEILIIPTRPTFDPVTLTAEWRPYISMGVTPVLNPLFPDLDMNIGSISIM